MCTLSWLRQRDGYTVFFNRDERRTRPEALPPATAARNGVRFLAPSDPEGGGTWIVVNDRRVTVALLNRYHPSPNPPAQSVSRGQLVLGLADVGSMAALQARLAGASLRPYQPFTLAVFAPGLPALLFNWDGTSLMGGAHELPGLLAVSSSLVPVEAERSRKALFQESVAAAGGTFDAALLERLHRSHLPERGALSVCMHRDDASTVSLTRVDAAPERVSLRYHAGSPCDPATPVTALELSLTVPS
jgi:Transport and Golgi organisation 2